MSLDELRGKHAGETAWIVGKGPSLGLLCAEDIGEGFVIALNQSIAVVQELGLPNVIYSYQKDGCGLIGPHEECQPRDGHDWMIRPKDGVNLILQQPDFSEFCLCGTPCIYIDPVQDFNFEFPETMAVQVSIALAKFMGCDEIVMVCCDSLSGDIFETFDVHTRQAVLTGAGEFYPYVRPLVLKDLDEIPHRILTPGKDFTMNSDEIIQQAAKIPSWTTDLERRELLRLAQEVCAGGLIVEIGGLYGGMTAVLGMANPAARIVVVDNFSWSPIEDKPANKEELMRNVTRCGVANVSVHEGDSREIGKTWSYAIDLLWIDGGHSYEFVRSDLDLFGPHAKTIALHDWDNPFWPSIRKAVEDFIEANPEWVVEKNVDMVVVLRRNNLTEFMTEVMA